MSSTITAQKPHCREFAAQSRSPKFNEGRHYLLRKTALQRIRGAIAKPTLNIGQQQLPRKNHAAKNFRRSGAIAKPKNKHKSATITAQSNAAKNLRRNREAQNEARVSNHYHAHESAQPTQNMCSSAICVQPPPYSRNRNRKYLVFF